MKEALKWLLFLVIGGLTFASFAVPGAKLFPQPELARVIFFHLPCALSCTLFFYWGAYLSYRVLTSPDTAWDVRAVSANEVGMVLALLTMATGIIFSRVQWGAWWNWDPRQTSFLFVLLLYGAYFVVRANFTDSWRRAKISAAYALACVLPASFCIFVFPRILFSLHPSTTLIQNQLDPSYRSVFYPLFFAVLILAGWIYKLAVRSRIVELSLLESHGKLEIHSGDSASSGVVRPVSLSQES